MGEYLQNPPPELSLCIPTYNRSALLTQSLQAVLSQIGPEEAAQVEVVVLDNASPDGTPGVVEEAGRQAPHVGLRSLRHPENLGMDRNFLEAIRQARGKFVCLLSDDDLLLPGAVAKLLALIRQWPEFDGFCLNVSPFRDDPLEEAPRLLEEAPRLLEEAPRLLEEAPRLLDIKEDVVLRDRDAVLQLIRSSITFLSILAFRKARIAEPLAAGKYQSMIGTYCLQGYVYLDAIAAGNNFVAVARPMVANRVENSHALNYFQVFITELTALLNYAENLGFSRRLIQRSKAENLKDARYFITRVMIYGRQTEAWSSRPDAIRRLFRVYGFSPYLWLVIVPLMFFPRSLRPLAFLIRRLLGRPYIAPKDEMDRPGGVQAADASH